MRTRGHTHNKAETVCTTPVPLKEGLPAQLGGRWSANSVQPLAPSNGPQQHTAASLEATPFLGSQHLLTKQDELGRALPFQLVTGQPWWTKYSRAPSWTGWCFTRPVLQSNCSAWFFFCPLFHRYWCLINILHPRLHLSTASPEPNLPRTHAHPLLKPQEDFKTVIFLINMKQSMLVMRKTRSAWKSTGFIESDASTELGRIINSVLTFLFLQRGNTKKVERTQPFNRFLDLWVLSVIFVSSKIMLELGEVIF